jgi:hypothetical protein
LIVVVLCAGLAGGCGRALLGAFYLSHGSALLAGQANEPVALNAAAEALARARALLPDNSLVLRRSAELYRRQGRDDAAVAALEQALALQPSSQLLQRELMLAYLRVKDSERSAVLLEKLTGAGGGVELVGDGYLRAGQAARALEIYTLSLAANDAPPEPLLVRTGLLSAALGDAAEARRLLEASGAPTPVDALVEAVSRTPDGEVHVGDDGLLVAGVPQRLVDAPLLLFRGANWYPPEPTMGRWAASPAELTVYTPVPRTVRMRLIFTALVDPQRAEGLSDQGLMRVERDGAVLAAAAVAQNRENVLTLSLPAGWSRLQLVLDAGNLRPSEHLPNSGDARLLGFALYNLNLEPQ